MSRNSHPWVFENLGIGVAQIAMDGSWVANRHLRELLGFPADILPAIPFDKFFESNHLTIEAQERKRLLAGEILNYSSERSAIRHDGKRLWVKAVFSLQRDEVTGDRKWTLATIQDMTSLRVTESALDEAELARREVARRLAGAQDNERTRIARELHDDIGQSLAILGMQMMRAGKPVSNMPGKSHPGVADLCDHLRSIAAKVSALSHQLHPARLEYLGLAVAVKAQCREFSEKYKIPVECSCDDIPRDLDALIGLSFLRVVQEALHNVGKHSGATSVQVSLRGSAKELWLVVADNGKGFDMEEARLAAGLGLISMRERIYLAGGELTVSSKPAVGTQISATVPLVDGPMPASSASS
jgi:PAS domain S-box-containing protein